MYLRWVSQQLGHNIHALVRAESNCARVVQWMENWAEDRKKVRPGKRRAEAGDMGAGV